jgi:hypothetical protein
LHRGAIPGGDRGNNMQQALTRVFQSFAVVAAILSLITPSFSQTTGRCGNFPESRSTAFNPSDGKITLSWRTDFPTTLPATGPNFGDFRANWQDYMYAVLAEVRSAGFRIENYRIVAPPDAPWWITPWMDYDTNGRERFNGLTKERGPEVGDLAPNSQSGSQVWAIGFYNRQGAYSLGQVFADPCNPSVPVSGLEFPDGATSFKFLFTDEDPQVIRYLSGSPEVSGWIDSPGSGSRSNPATRSERKLRLLQVDIAVRDTRAETTSWVFGTFVWQGPAKGDGLFDNLVPVGLMWGNDPAIGARPRDAFVTFAETRLNNSLAGILWEDVATPWPQRPWPGLHGRLNGPADNLRSSCMSCHALAQWPRSRRLGILSRVSLPELNRDDIRETIRVDYMRNTKGGKLVDPTEADKQVGWGGARALDYSLQIEAAVTRMCGACLKGDLSGPTPELCQVEGHRNHVGSTTCPAPSPDILIMSLQSEEEPPRQ